MVMVTKKVSDIGLVDVPDADVNAYNAALQQAETAKADFDAKLAVSYAKAAARAQAQKVLEQASTAARADAKREADAAKLASQAAEHAANTAREAYHTAKADAEAKAVTVDLRVAAVSFSGSSSNAAVHRPRVGAPQATVGHLTDSTVSVQCDIDRKDFGRISAMLGRNVVVRFFTGGTATGLLLAAEATGEPASWEADEPYVAVGLTVAALSYTVWDS